MNKYYYFIIILTIPLICLATDQPVYTTRTLYKKTKFVTNKKPEKKTIPVPLKDPAKDQLLKKALNHMSVEELTSAKEYAAAQDKKDLVIKYLKQLLLEVKEPELLRTVRLELADLYFEQGDMKKAAHLYLEYVKFYPGSKSRDYAQYKAVLSRFYARLKPPLDQSKTRRTINLANRYLQATDLPNKKYTHEVEKIRHACYQDLFTYETDIVDQYFNLGKITAAETRIEGIKKEFLPVLSEVEPQLIEFEGLLAQKQGKNSIANEKIVELQTKFPTYEPSKLALNKPTKKSHAYRF